MRPTFSGKTSVAAAKLDKHQRTLESEMAGARSPPRQKRRGLSAQGRPWRLQRLAPAGERLDLGERHSTWPQTHDLYAPQRELLSARTSVGLSACTVTSLCCRAPPRTHLARNPWRGMAKARETSDYKPVRRAGFLVDLLAALAYTLAQRCGPPSPSQPWSPLCPCSLQPHLRRSRPARQRT